MDFGELFRQERKRAGKNLGEVAQRLKVSLTYLSDVERSTRPPLSIDRIRDAAVFMAIPGDRVLALLKAAAAYQGAFELPVPSSSMGKEAGAALARGWNSLDDDAFRQIVDVVTGGKGKVR
jgi:transcriptional regulator with XRE-family HTH domain